MGSEHQNALDHINNPHTSIDEVLEIIESAKARLLADTQKIATATRGKRTKSNAADDSGQTLGD